MKNKDIYRKNYGNKENGEDSARQFSLYIYILLLITNFNFNNNNNNLSLSFEYLSTVFHDNDFEVCKFLFLDIISDLIYLF